MSLDSIRQISDTEFLVTSGSHPGHHYLIDINEQTCDCADFPRIRHCKHIAALNVHFPRLCPKVGNGSKIPERACVLNLPKPTARSEEETAQILLKDINALCQQLNGLSDRQTPDLTALKGVKYSLTAAISWANGSWALPKKDVFHPNRNTWAETAKCIGVGKAPKRKPGPTSRNTSTECIGPVKGKRARKYTDPYAAGKRSGKHAKPNAVSVAANERAHASVPAPLPPSPRVDSPARASPSAARPFTCTDRTTANPLAYPAVGAVPGPAFLRFPTTLPGLHSSAHTPPSDVVAGFAAHSFTFSDQSTMGPHAYPASGAVPGLVFAPFPTAPSGYALVAPSAAVPGSAHTGIFALTCFRAEITPGNAFAHAHSTLDTST